VKLNIIIMIGLVLVVAYGTQWFQNQPPPVPVKPVSETVREVPVSVAEPMQGTLPYFLSVALDGSAVEPNRFKGKFAALNFWATWCPPCVEEFPRLLSIAKEYPDDFVLVLFSSDKSEDDIDRFVARLTEEEQAILEQDNVIMIWDDTGEATFGVFKVERYPETILVDRKGKLLGKLKGADWGKEAITDYIDADS